MNRQKWIILFVTLGLIGGTAALLTTLRLHQRLGLPGIRTAAIPGSRRMEIYLPDLVLDYKSSPGDLDPRLFTDMPPDSSFTNRIYTSSDGFRTLLNVVLMGTDRSTIHKPQFCLIGSGWAIDESKSAPTTIQMQRPQPYELPVMKLLTSREFKREGNSTTLHGVYVYWFVADGQLTGSHGTRMLSMATNLLKTGVLQRWAYITCFSYCEPGQEDATYARMQKFIQSSVPQFQLVPGSRNAGTAVTETASTQFR